MAEERQKEVQAVYEQAARECDEKVPGDANTPFMDLLKAHGGPPGTFSSHSRERLLPGDVERCLPSGGLYCAQARRRGSPALLHGQQVLVAAEKRRLYQDTMMLAQTKWERFLLDARCFVQVPMVTTVATGNTCATSNPPCLRTPEPEREPPRTRINSQQPAEVEVRQAVQATQAQAGGRQY